MPYVRPHTRKDGSQVRGHYRGEERIADVLRNVSQFLQSKAVNAAADKGIGRAVDIGGSLLGVNPVVGNTLSDAVLDNKANLTGALVGAAVVGGAIAAAPLATTTAPVAATAVGTGVGGAGIASAANMSAAARVAYIGNPVLAQQQLNQLGTGLQITAQLKNAPTGFNAYLMGGGGKNFIAFGGTEIKSPGAIASYLSPTSPGALQFHSVKSKLAEWAAQYPDALLVGHSQGGSLAQLYAAQFPNGGVVTFNSPGVSKSAAKAVNTPVSHFTTAQGSIPDIFPFTGERMAKGKVFVKDVGGNYSPLNTEYIHNAFNKGVSPMGAKSRSYSSFQGSPLRSPAEKIRKRIGVGLYSAPVYGGAAIEREGKKRF